MSEPPVPLHVAGRAAPCALPSGGRTPVPDDLGDGPGPGAALRASPARSRTSAIQVAVVDQVGAVRAGAGDQHPRPGVTTGPSPGTTK